MYHICGKLCLVYGNELMHNTNQTLHNTGGCINWGGKPRRQGKHWIAHRFAFNLGASQFQRDRFNCLRPSLRLTNITEQFLAFAVPALLLIFSTSDTLSTIDRKYKLIDKLEGKFLGVGSMRDIYLAWTVWTWSRQCFVYFLTTEDMRCFQTSYPQYIRELVWDYFPKL